MVVFNGSPTKESDSMLTIKLTTRQHPRWLEEKSLPDFAKIAEVALVRKTLAWITGIILIVSTLMGVSSKFFFIPLTSVSVSVAQYPALFCSVLLKSVISVCFFCRYAFCLICQSRGTPFCILMWSLIKCVRKGNYGDTKDYCFVYVGVIYLIRLMFIF